MKNIIITTVLLFLTSMGYAQQDVFKYISNSYITSANSLNTLTAIKNYRTLIEFPPNIPDEITDKKTYYKISYKPESGSISASGLLNITYKQVAEVTDEFEKEFNVFFNGMLSDMDPADYINEIVEVSGVNGGYFFRKSKNSIFFYIKSNAKKGSLTGLLQINSLTDAQKKAFLKDFIQKMKFK